jgi:hypothetical protein
MNNPGFYRVVTDDPKQCVTCGRVAFWTIAYGVGEEETGIGMSWEDKEMAEDICELMNMAYGAGTERNAPVPIEAEEMPDENRATCMECMGTGDSGTYWEDGSPKQCRACGGDGSVPQRGS